MSDRPKYPRAAALAVAEDLQARLAPACERIAIVGSLRRGKPQVGDAELLFVSRTRRKRDGLFDEIEHWWSDDVIESWLKEGLIAKRPNVNGQFAWGEANKLAFHCASGLPVDLFSVRPEQWWVSLVVRTGSKENNVRLCSAAQARGAKLNAYGYGVTWSDATTTAATSEEHVFELCGVPYLKPEER